MRDGITIIRIKPKGRQRDDEDRRLREDRLKVRRFERKMKQRRHET